MIDRGEVGLVRALSLRWHTPLPDAADSRRLHELSAQEARAFEGEVASVAAALDLLLEFALPQAWRDESPLLERVVSRVHAHENAGAGVALLEFAGGVGASMVLGAGDEWNAPLPRLEIVGTQGRFLVCEGARSLSLHAPREATRTWSVPSLAPSLSGAEASGVAEDVRSFLNAVLHSKAGARSAASHAPASGRGESLARAHSLGRASLLLRLWEELSGTTRASGASREEARRPSDEQSASKPAAPSCDEGRPAQSEQRSDGRARDDWRRTPAARGTLLLPFDE
jgi:hypothetical protein